MTDSAPAIWFPTIRAGTGADVFTTRLCEGLNARGIRAEITWLPHRAEYLPWFVAVPRPPAWATVAHVNSWLPLRFWPAALPTVVTVHHLVHDPVYRPYRSWLQAAYHATLIRPRELRAIRDAAVVTTVSDYVKQTVREFSGRDGIEVVYNWIDTERFAPSRDRKAHPNQPFVLFMASSHSRRKGLDLLPAFIAALGPGFQLRYAGGVGGVVGEIPGVVALGRVSDDTLIREYQACDAVVSLSRYEGFGYTALEAMACGKPFLGFATSGLSEVVATNGGLLVNVDDVAALATAARTIRDQPVLAAEMGRQGRIRAASCFAGGNVEGYLRAYSAVMASGDSGSMSP